MTNHDALCKTLTDEANKLAAHARKEALRYQNFKKAWMLDTIETYRQKAFTLWTVACGLINNGYSDDMSKVVEITSDAESEIAEIYNEMSALADKELA